MLVANRGEIALRVIRACAQRSGCAPSRSTPTPTATRRTCGRPTSRCGSARPPQPSRTCRSPRCSRPPRDRGRRGPPRLRLPVRAGRRSRRAVAEAGLVFIGPPADVMDAMGRKDRAREIAVAAGVPVVPAADSDVGRPRRRRRRGRLPLAGKAAAGGGGKGMRIVRSEAELAEAVARPGARPRPRSATTRCCSSGTSSTAATSRCRSSPTSTATSSTCSSATARCSAGTRRCSRRRRPPRSPTAVRELVLSSAVALAREVGYVNAGTVEFLVAGDDAYFLEMNTRLQVEHPVTELVTGLDLVAAAARDRPRRAAAVRPGRRRAATATRSRPASTPRTRTHGFLPQAGVADVRALADRGPGRRRARVRPGVGTPLRPDARQGDRLRRRRARRPAGRWSSALDETAILGLTTNVGFLRDLARLRRLPRRRRSTPRWLDRHPDGVDSTAPHAAWCWPRGRSRPAAARTPSDPFGAGDGWRLAGPPAPCRRAGRPEVADSDRVLDGRRPASIAGPTAPRVRSRWRRADGTAAARDRRRPDAGTSWSTSRVLVAYPGQTWSFDRPDAFGPARRTAAGDGTVTAPMPGRCWRSRSRPATAVEEGDTLGVMEAMKMELALKAPFAGVGQRGRRRGRRAGRPRRRALRGRRPTQLTTGCTP